LDSLKSSLRWGCSSKAFQIRPIVDLDSPQRSAIDLRDQCVALAGADSSVATTTSSTCSAVTDTGRPGRGSSTNPSQRPSTNRRRHLPTVGCATRSRAATSFDRPSAQPSTIRDRNASACADDRLFDEITAMSAQGSRLATEYHPHGSAFIAERNKLMARQWESHGLDLDLSTLMYHGERNPTAHDPDSHRTVRAYGRMPDDLASEPMQSTVAVTAIRS
jgi:hypothetical protein